MSTSPKRDRIDWAEMPVVFIIVPTYPVCGSTRYERTRTEANGDQSRTKKVVCRECSQPYKISLELPDSGENEI